MPWKDRTKRLAYAAAYRAKNRETLRQKSEEYHEQHRDEENAQSRERYHANRDTILQARVPKREAAAAWQRNNRADHPEHVRALDQAQRFKTHEAHRERDQSYYRANKTTRNAQSRAHRQKHRERYTAHDKLYRQSHPELYAAVARRKRARRYAAPRNDLTTAQEALVIAVAHGVCVYCPAYNPHCTECLQGTHTLTIDHITALSQGGSHTLFNVVAACVSCNSRKFVNPPPVPVQPLLL